jgi:hypothetical protein
MAKKPHKLRRVLYDDSVIDADPTGEYGRGAAEDAGAESQKQVGRPLDSTTIDYEDMDLLIGFRQAYPSALTQGRLIALISYVYEQRHGGAPARSTIMARIKLLEPKR